jgi:hypothetical protein
MIKCSPTRAVASVARSRTGCARAKISAFLHQIVMRESSGRCQMCGSTVARQAATLVVDYSRPGNWDGAHNLGNFWAICQECDAGRRAYFSHVNVDPQLVRKVTTHESVHVRIGELLKAVGIGNRVPSSLIEYVAGQSGWRQRLRELRYPVIGWKIKARTYKETSGRKRSDYVLVSHEPWPQDPTNAIMRYADTRRKQNVTARNRPTVAKD